MNLTQTTAPTAEPITLAEAALHLRVDTDADDALIQMLIGAARETFEEITQRQLVCATWQMKLGAFPSVFYVPRPPLIEVSSITYVDTNGVTQTLASDQYDVDAGSEPGIIRPAYGVTWPTPRSHPDVVIVTFVAGYATPFTAATSDILTWSGRNPTDADIVRLTTTAEDLPDPLAADTDYHVRDASGATCKLAATAGGVAIDIIDAGTGRHFIGTVPWQMRSCLKLMLADLYEHREAQLEARVQENETIKRLLWLARANIRV